MSGDIISDLKARAAAKMQTVVLPETEDKRTFLAAAQVVSEGFAKVILVGASDSIAKTTAELKVKLPGVEIMDPATTPLRQELADFVFERRKAKGMTPEKALEFVSERVNFAAALVATGRAGGYVSGACHTTADTLRPALQIIGCAPGFKTVSSYFVMVSPLKEYGDNGVLFYADSGLVPDPTVEQLAEIAVSTAHTARNVYGIEPRVAMLSFSTKGSAQHPLVDKVRAATELVKSMAPDILVDGELQADAALVPDVAAKKAPGSPIAGRANVLIFPDLNVGNICYKITERLGSAQAFGPLVQGLKHPANDLSRGCSASDIVGVVAVTAVVAGSQA
jgi:phosphate acetyltransferase